MTHFTPPPGYNRIKVVKSFHELVTIPFECGVNALCWQRSLPGNFGEVVEHLVVSPGITTLDESRIASLGVSAAGKVAIEVLIEDQRLLRTHGTSPVLDCVCGYHRDDESGPVSTDVYSFHVDSATVETDTYLCTYHGPTTEGLRNDEAQRRVDLPETRSELLRVFGGEDNDEFIEYLKENHYDLHYAPAPDSQPFFFGLGNLWRVAVKYPGSPVPPFIHRAPETLPGQPSRLLLIS